MRHLEVSVHTLVSLLYLPDLQKIQDEEENVSQKFRFKYCSKIFRRFYPYGGYLFEIFGSPYGIDYNEGCVEEMKVYGSEESKEMQTKIGRVQLMFDCWLTGLNCGKLILRNIKNDEKNTIRYNFSKEEIEKVVEKAIEKYIKLIEW
jgi:hypothetical protein